MGLEDGVDWQVGWNRSFERELEKLKDSGSFEHIRKTIEKIVNNPVRTGRYKEGTLKGCRTTHVKEKIIGWEVTPGVSTPDLQHEVEEVYFHFIVHHDDQETAFKQRVPAEKSATFEINLEYFGGYVIQEELHRLYEWAKGVDECELGSPDWQEDQVTLEGAIASEKRDDLIDVLPEGTEVDIDDTSLF